MSTADRKTRAMSLALHKSRTTGNTRVIAALLAESTDDSGITTVSVGQLMKASGLCRNTVKRAIRRLVDSGEIRCLITTDGRRLGRVSRQIEEQAEDGRAVYQLNGELSLRKAA